MLLNVNLNYLINLKNVIGGSDPEIVKCARICEYNGASSFTIHLYEDLSKINLSEVKELNEILKRNLVLKISPSEVNQNLALDIMPKTVCITTESDEESPIESFNVLKNSKYLKEYLKPFKKKGILTSVLIDPDIDQVTSAYKSGVDYVELNTKSFSELFKTNEHLNEFIRIKEASTLATTLGMKVVLCNGINYYNIKKLKELTKIQTIVVGHSITSKAIFDGLNSAVKEMKEIIDEK